MTTTWSTYTQQLVHYALQEQLFHGAKSALLAVSGGVDSMMLLESMVALQEYVGLERMGVVYVDHGLRPDDTPAEAAFVKERAAHWGLPATVAHLDIEVKGGSLQDAARQARRAALVALADRERWDVIVTGHHRDDQAETLLLRLLRGTSSDGLSGIAPRAGRWVHPLLPFPRETLESLARRRQVPWKEDPSNRSFRFLRNQIRHELLPSLEQTYNPQLRGQLARLADQVRADEQYFEARIDEHFGPPLLERRNDGLALQLEHWDQLDGVLRWRLMRRMIHEVYQGALPLHHVEQLTACANERDGEKQLSLPEGLHCVRRYDQLILTRAPLESPQRRQETEPHAPVDIDLSAPGQQACGAGTLCWEPLPPAEGASSSAVPPARLSSPWEAFLPGADAAGRWLVRYRQPGDQLVFDFGHRPLKKWMIDAKIPKSMRYHIPLLARIEPPAERDASSDQAEGCGEADEAASRGQITWVIGHRHALPLTKQRPQTGWWLRFVPRED